ncbi:MAG: hypothetical protein O6927_06170 [Gammaproteobacteria bacterium]|nr:hypothetical protein [Gammaproteobacteria bacterium]
MDFVFQRIDLRAVLVLIIALLILPASIAGESNSSSFGQVAIPDPTTPANAQQCVAPTDVMRRDHMKFLLHQREETVLKGIRTKKYSFTGCINCHAQAGKDGQIVRAEDPEYFCTECHTYAAVRIDCFECHSDRAAKITSRLEIGKLYFSLNYYDPPAIDPLRGRLHQTLLQQVEIREQR